VGTAHWFDRRRLGRTLPSASRGRARVLATIGLVILAACPGAKPIKELLDDPSRFDGEKVRIAGEVTESVGALGVGVYQINDGTGTLTVVSKAGNGTPRVGAKVGVEGDFRSAFTLGSRTVAVLMEQKRRSP
jgi:hypothetical protein